jgi:nucleoside-diphosphate-sugar epimerase
MRLAATGITSGIGMRLAEIALDRGDISITALVRDTERRDARELASRGVRVVRGDLEDKGALREMARGADVLVHMAAHVGDVGTPEQFERVNVGGTRNALEAAAAEGVTRFVQMSSSAVYGRPDAGRITEEWPTRKVGIPYDDTKTDAERLAFERGRELGLAVVAVRPPIIYGDYDRNFLPRAIEALRGRRFLLVDGGGSPLNVVWADHVVDVTLRAAERRDIAGEAFNVMDEVDNRPPSVREVGETIARELGLPPPSLSLPYPVAMAAGHVLARSFALARANKAPPLSPFVVKLLSRNVIYDASKAARMLGWSPKLSALTGIAHFAREARGEQKARRAG